MRKVIYITLCILLFSIMLSGCKKSIQEENKSDNEYVYAQQPVNIYSAVEYDAQLKEGQYIYLVDSDKKAIYYVVLNVLDDGEKFENRIYRLDYEKAAQADIELKNRFGWKNESEIDIISISEDITPEFLVDRFIGNIYSTDGKLYLLNKNYDSDMNSTDYLVYCIDENGGLEFVCDLTEGYVQAAKEVEEIIKNSSSSYDSFSVCNTANGLAFLIGFRSTSGESKHITYVVDMDNKIKKIDAEEAAEDRFEQIDDWVYVVSGKELERYYAADGSFQAEKVGSFEKDTYTGIVKNSLIENDTFKIMVYGSEGISELNNGVYSQMLKWTDMGLGGRKWKSIISYGSDHIFAIWYANGEMQIVDMTKSDMVAGNREKIVVGTLKESEQLSRMVRIFNASQGRYEAEVRVYDNVESLNTELIAGKGPDIFPTDAVDIVEYAEKGIIEDLGKYLDDEKSMLKREMLFEKVTNVFTVDNILVTIPDRFFFKAYIGLEDKLGEDGGWTIDELFDQLIAQPECTVYDFSLDTNDIRYHIAKLVLKGLKDTFVDIEEGKAYFDTEEFKQIIEFVKNYEVSWIDDTRTRQERIDDGITLVEAVQIVDIDYIADIMQSGRYVLKGYPNENCRAAYGIYAGNCFSINSNSEHKQAAWEFIQYVVMSLSHDDALKGTMNGFPAVIQQFDELLRISSQSHEEGYVVPERAVEQFYYMVENIEYMANGNNDVIMKIVDEEIKAMLYNNREADDTVRIIQDRVQLYLDER